MTRPTTIHGTAAFLDDGNEEKSRNEEQTVKSEKLTLSIPEAAKCLGISDTHMRQLARTKGFPAFNIGSRILISFKGLEAWVEKQAQIGMQV